MWSSACVLVVKLHPTRFVCALAVAIGACGASGPETPDDDGRAPASPRLHLEIGSDETFHFTWTNVDDETEYHLMEDADGASGYTRVAVLGAEVTSHDLAASLATRLNAVYAVDACNAYGCSRSAVVSVADVLANAFVYVKASNTDVWDLFGWGIAVSGDGDTLAVGAPLEDSSARGCKHPEDPDYAGSQVDNGTESSGAAYVFRREGGTWIPEAYIKSWNSDSVDRFGGALALSDDGDTLVVGAGGEDGNSIGGEADNSGNDNGAAYVFSRRDGRWYPEFYIKASNTDPGDGFGTAVALSGDGMTLAVGAPGEASRSAIAPDDDSVASAGAVYVFVRDASFWYQQAYLKAPVVDADDWFGHVVALSGDGDVLAVGCPMEDGSSHPMDNEAQDAGAVMVFERSGGSWDRRSYLKAPNADVSDWFGQSLSLSADGRKLVVGAPGEDSSSTGPDDGSLEGRDSGAVYVFTSDVTGWTPVGFIKSPTVDAWDRFGCCVSLSGDGRSLLVGVKAEDSSARGIGGNQRDNSALDSGAAWLFRSETGTPFVSMHYLKAPNTDASDGFGTHVAISDDGDTVAVASQSEDSSATGVGGDMYDNGAMLSGAVYVR